MSSKLYFQNLDASRFYAFILVFLAHCFVTNSNEVASDQWFNLIYNWGKLGILGLEYFFVLSSFLVTYIILEEKSQTKSFHVLNFMMRRSLRVWPLYFLMVSIGILAVFIGRSHGIEINELPPFPYLILFIVNFYIIEYGVDFIFFIGFLWSISVEEQFYLFWAIVMKWIKVGLPTICITLILTSIVFRIVYLGNDRTLLFHTISAFANFGFGGLLAYSLHKKSKVTLYISRWSKKTVGAIYGAFMLSIIFFHQLMDYEVFVVLERVYFAMFFSYLILEQTHGENRLFNLESLRFSKYLGKISYGLYCYHGLVITLFLFTMRKFQIQQGLFLSIFVFPVIILILSIFISHLSYKYFEGRFLQLKRKFYTFDV